MIDDNALSLRKGALPLAYSSTIRDIASLGIQALGWPILVKEANRNACLCGTSSNEFFCYIH